MGAHEKELKGGEPTSTNNRMELTAAIAGLEVLKWPCVVDMHTDSQYVRDGITKYIRNWKRNGWRTASKDPVKNEDLWRRLDAAVERQDRKSTRLNSSHPSISYAVFCLKKKNSLWLQRC